jgi:PIN domain nuclease of toxin-antitoxin system
VSAATAWEIEIKRALGKLDAPDDLADALAAGGYRPLPVSILHATIAGRLPPHHRDPFDRMLVAQAKLEGLTIVTGDRRIAGYDVPVLWE